MCTTFTQEGYLQKARGTHARVQRVRVTLVLKVGTSLNNLNKNCVRCKESANCVKTLQTKLGKIEQLVRHLETTTTKYTEEVNITLKDPFSQYIYITLTLFSLPCNIKNPILLLLLYSFIIISILKKVSPHQKQQQQRRLQHYDRQRLARLLTRKNPPTRLAHRGIDLSKLDFTEFQKLVAVTTNISSGGKSHPDDEITPSP